MNAFRNMIHTTTPVIGAAKAGCHITEVGYTYRSIGPRRLTDLQTSGLVREKPGDYRVWWSTGNGRLYYRPDQIVIRIRSNLLSETQRATIKDIEIWDKALDAFVPVSSR